MGKTVEQLTRQMERLQRQIDAARDREVAGVVARIRVAIAHYQLTPAQLFASKPVRAKAALAPAPRARKKAARSPTSRASGGTPRPGNKLPPKYRDDAGNAWTGRGSTPRWLRDALAAGKSREDFAVTP